MFIANDPFIWVSFSSTVKFWVCFCVFLAFLSWYWLIASKIAPPSKPTPTYLGEDVLMKIKRLFVICRVWSVDAFSIVVICCSG